MQGRPVDNGVGPEVAHVAHTAAWAQQPLTAPDLCSQLCSCGPTRSISLHPPPQALPASAGICPAHSQSAFQFHCRSESPSPLLKGCDLAEETPLFLQAEGPGGKLWQCSDAALTVVLVAEGLPDTFTSLLCKKLGLKSPISQANKPLLEKKGTACGLKP